MQAIEVKYLGPTYARGSRLVVFAEIGRKIYSQEHLDFHLQKRGIPINYENRAKLAVEFFRNAVGWNNQYYGRVVNGTLKNGNEVFVFTREKDEIQ